MIKKIFSILLILFTSFILMAQQPNYKAQIDSIQKTYAYNNRKSIDKNLQIGELYYKMKYYRHSIRYIEPYINNTEEEKYFNILISAYNETNNKKKIPIVTNRILFLKQKHLAEENEKSKEEIERLKKLKAKSDTIYKDRIKLTIKTDTQTLNKYIVAANNASTLEDILSLVNDSIVQQKIKIKFLEQENTYKQNLITEKDKAILGEKLLKKYTMIISGMTLLITIIIIVLYIQIKSKNKTLKSVTDMKNKLFSVMAHDIKSPLRNIKTTVDIIEKKKTYDMLPQIGERVKLLYEFTENIITWAKSQYDNTKPIFEKLSFVEIINTNYELLKPLLDEKNIKLNFDSTTDVEFNGDKNMINTIVRNLLSNAIKFSYRDTSIDVSITQDKYTIISIRDYGVGMPDEAVTKIYNMESVQSTKGTNNEAGTGLGLIICSEFARQHDGKLLINNKLDKGTEFQILLKK